MRNCRNFFTTIAVDGKKTDIATGPRQKNGGFSQAVYVRHNGDSVLAYTIEGIANENGGLTVEIRDKNGKLVDCTFTNR